MRITKTGQTARLRRMTSRLLAHMSYGTFSQVAAQMFYYHFAGDFISVAPYIIFERDKTNEIAYAPSEDSDQSSPCAQ